MNERDRRGVLFFLLVKVFKNLNSVLFLHVFTIRLLGQNRRSELANISVSYRGGEKEAKLHSTHFSCVMRFLSVTGTRTCHTVVGQIFLRFCSCIRVLGQNRRSELANI